MQVQSYDLLVSAQQDSFWNVYYKANLECSRPQSDHLSGGYLSSALSAALLCQIVIVFLASRQARLSVGTQPAASRCFFPVQPQSSHLVCTVAGLLPPPLSPSSTVLFSSCFLQAVAPPFASRLSVNLSFPLFPLLPRIYLAAFLLQLCHSRGFPLLLPLLSLLGPLLLTARAHPPTPVFVFFPSSLLSSAGATWTHSPGPGG